MKHVVNRSRSAAKTKAKTLTQNKAVAKIKLTAKKTAGKIALSTNQSPPVRKVNSTIEKAGSKSSARAAQPAAKILNVQKTVSARKAKLAAKLIEKPKVSKSPLKAPAKNTGTIVQKAKTTTPVKQTKLVEKKSSTRQMQTKLAVTQKAKPKAVPVKAQIAAKASFKLTDKTSVKKAKTQSPKIAVRAAKARRPKEEIIVPAKIKSTARKAKSTATPTKIKNARKAKLIVEAKPDKRKITMPAVSTKNVALKPGKGHPVVVTEKTAVKTILKGKNSIQPVVAAKKLARKAHELQMTIPAVKIKKQKAKLKKNITIEKIKLIKNPVEAVAAPAQKPRNKKARPISSAVFRGKKERYDFKVFALNETFEPIPAVYIISKRKTDRNKKGHHALVCIGQTDSIFDELKRHRKGSCVKKHAANVVSILPETDEKTRLKIENDLKAAHAVACSLK